MNLLGPLFRNKRFVFNKIFQQNDLKFTIFYFIFLTLRMPQSLSTNKSIANFEAFYWNISFSRNILLMKNAYLARPLALSRDFGSKTQNRCMQCIHITDLIQKIAIYLFLQEMSRKNGNPVCVSNKSFLKTIPTITIQRQHFQMNSPTIICLR